MSQVARLEISLTLRSPFMFQGLANSRLGVDAAFLRDERGRACHPRRPDQGGATRRLRRAGQGDPKHRTS